MKKFIGLLIFIGLLVFLFLSCPDKQEHNKAFIESLPELAADFGFDENIPDINSPEVQELIESIAGPVATALGVTIVDVDNYLIFSIGKFNGQIVSFGIGGHVFSYKDDLVKKAVDLARNHKE